MNKPFGNNFIIQAALLGCLFVLGCENDPVAIKELSQKKIMLEQVDGVESLFSQNGKMRSKLNAPLMLIYQADTLYYEFPKSLHVNFFDSTGKMESHLDALYGKYYKSLSKIYLRDSVLVFNVKGDTLWSPDLWWDQNTQKFYTDKKVRIHKSGNRIYGGQGLEANQDLTNINIRQITGTLIPDSSATH
jgi:LPS export ABC transporter protein LptC